MKAREEEIARTREWTERVHLLQN